MASSLRASSPIWESEASLARTREQAAKPRGAKWRGERGGTLNLTGFPGGGELLPYKNEEGGWSQFRSSRREVNIFTLEGIIREM